MKKKTISLRGISEILSEKDLKNVVGGSYGDDVISSCCIITCNDGFESRILWGPSCYNGYLVCYGDFKQMTSVECPKEMYFFP